MSPALILYRDDGPIARLIGAALRPLSAAPQSLIVLAAAAPMFVLMALKGDGASHAAVGGVLAWLVLVGGATSGGQPTDRLRWTVPPVLRLSEYAGLLWIGSLAGESSQPAAFALISVLTFRHYDFVYRLGHQGSAPPDWVGNLAGGWDGRLVLGYILLVANALPAGFYIAAGLLAAVFVAESIAGWRRFGRAEQPVTYEDEEDEGQ
ncbi:MAG: hypothetical protein QOK19_1295 [Solirubrobacteraceae bacterium]|nr:hypothetical protein [Solirubrobacteraceae bacterium]